MYNSEARHTYKMWNMSFVSMARYMEVSLSLSTIRVTKHGIIEFKS